MAAMLGVVCGLCAGLVWAGHAAPRAPIRTIRSRSSCRSRPAARPTSWRGCWRTNCPRPRSAILCRGPCRRRRQYRHDEGRARRARRLHDPGGQFELRGQSEPVRQQALRPVQGFRAGHTGRRLAEYCDRASLGAGENRQGTDRADAGQSGQIRHRQCRPRHHAATRRRTVQARLQARQPSVPLWRRRAGDPGRDRQSNADRFCQSDAGDAAHPGRDAARHRGDLPQALRGAARRADHDRSRRSGPGIRNHAGCFRGWRNAAGHRRCSTARSSRRCSSRTCKEKCKQVGLEIVADTPAEFAAYIKKEVDRWDKVIVDAKIPHIQ